MLQINRHKFSLPIKELWFASDASLFDFFAPVSIIQSNNSKGMFGYRRSIFATKIIDLTATAEEILARCDKTASYEIKRAKRDGVTMSISEDWSGFFRIYCEFANLRGLKPLTWEYLTPILPHAILVQAIHQDQPVVMHVYLLDKSKRRCRLLYSASLFRSTNDNCIRANVGRANRYLHYASMLHFKNMHFDEYDLGGYAINTDEDSLLGINKFKDSFGGELRTEYNYTSWALIFLQTILRTFTRNA